MKESDGEGVATMRETRLCGSVEGVMGNHDSYSGSLVRAFVGSFAFFDLIVPPASA